MLARDAAAWSAQRRARRACPRSRPPRRRATGPSGTVEVKLNAPLTLRPGVEYTASYLATYGEYADQRRAFASPQSVGPVHFPANAGVYQYGGGFPGDSWNSSGYYVSPVVAYDASATSPAEPPSTGPWALFDGTTTIADPAANDPDKVELGVRFSVGSPPAGNYVVRAVRFYRAPLHPMVENRVYVYDAAGTVVAHGEAIGEGGPSGVVDVLLNAPLKLTPGTIYTASYVATNGYYANDRGAFASAPTDRCSSPPTRASTGTAAASHRELGVVELLRQPAGRARHLVNCPAHDGRGPHCIASCERSVYRNVE